MRKIIFVLLALLLTLAGCGKEALPETSSVPSEDTHITSPSEEKTEQSTVPSSEPAKTTEVAEETAVSNAGKRYFRQFRKGAETKHIFQADRLSLLKRRLRQKAHRQQSRRKQHRLCQMLRLPMPGRSQSWSHSI